jgi:glyoxylase-like metal-dependent hydrolase (beta-lactamase superfamily II)
MKPPINYVQTVDENIYMINLTPPEFGIDFISGYIINHEEDIIIIEQGPRSTVDRITTFLEELETQNKNINLFVTHLHLDHSGSVGTLLNNYWNIKAFVHPRGAKHLIDPEKLWRGSLNALGWIAEVYGKPDPAPAHKLKIVDDKEKASFGDNQYEFIYTEGHASHHISIYWHNKDAIFVGDSNGIYIRELDYILPTTIYPVKIDLYIKSIEKMAEYKPKYLFYPHFGIVKNGYKKLLEHKNTVIRWYNLAENESPKDIEEYKKMLAEKDRKFGRFLTLTEKMQIVNILIEFSLYGILNAVGK